MKTAVCLTPDLAFFRQAAFTASTILAQADAGAFDLFIICEEADVAPGFAQLDPALRARINLLCVDFSSFDRDTPGRGRFSRAVFRRLFLDRVLPESYARIVSVDSDMLIRRPGLGRLAEIDLGGAPIAAAYDMLFLMDFNGGALARSFQRHRRTLGLGEKTPYFNAGLMAIDRARWSALELGERALAALRAVPGRYPFMEQSALNELIAGGFAPLSPRYNFMGDFFLLDLEAPIDPIALHFVNHPKPWNLDVWRGEARFARDYQAWFAASPWPDYLAQPPAKGLRPGRPRKTPARRAFAERMMAFFRTCAFADGWRAPGPAP
ncbi:glycosyltransferase [Methylocapsa sp. S129]|uniref:glycosyltransferase family 8 protein n=1 Tax=Methylocapsa sp. S129 TaxID=1641869 RepID=UPI00131C39AB|nr:glycosyltransferase [Methylocapsa sp. S129]